MKQLTCEMCGGIDLVKNEGLFVCQNCGTKYSVEEAKKLLIEGSVEIHGTVSIESKKELNNLCELAERSLKSNDFENAEKYYQQILLLNPSDWKATFYSSYLASYNCKIAEVIQKLDNFLPNIKTTLELIKEHVIDSEAQTQAVSEVVIRINNLSDNHFIAYKDYFFKLPADLRVPETFSTVCHCTRAIRYNCGNSLIEVFDDRYSEKAIICWSSGNDLLRIQLALLNSKVLMGAFFKDYRTQYSDSILASFQEKIDKYDKTNPKKVDNTPESANITATSQKKNRNSSGCYVATAVYGSYDCPEVWTLRRYRDFTLAETWYGRAFIRTYYAISPTLVEWFGHTEWFKKMWKGKLDRMVKNLQENGVEDTPYEDKNW